MTKPDAKKIIPVFLWNNAKYYVHTLKNVRIYFSHQTLRRTKNDFATSKKIVEILEFCLMLANTTISTFP